MLTFPLSHPSTISLSPPFLLNASGPFLGHIAFSLPRLTVCDQFVEPFQTTILKTALSTLSGTASTEAYTHTHSQSGRTHRDAAPAPKRKTWSNESAERIKQKKVIEKRQ